jgi:hypothetical protein
VEADNSRTAAAAADEEAGQWEGLDNIHSLAGVVPGKGAVLDRNLVDGDSSLSRDIQNK